MEGATWQRIGLAVEAAGFVLAGLEIWGKQAADKIETRFTDILKRSTSRAWIYETAGRWISVPALLIVLILTIIYFLPADSVGRQWESRITAIWVAKIIQLIPAELFAWTIIVGVFWTFAGSVLALGLFLTSRSTGTAFSDAKQASNRIRGPWQVKVAVRYLLMAILATFALYQLVIAITAKIVRLVSFGILKLLMDLLNRLDNVVKGARIPRTVPVIGFLVVAAGLVLQFIGTF